MEAAAVAVAERGGSLPFVMAGRGSGSSEHLERLHEIFRALHGDLRGVPERLRGSVAGEAGGGRPLSLGGGGEGGQQDGLCRNFMPRLAGVCVASLCLVVRSLMGFGVCS